MFFLITGAFQSDTLFSCSQNPIVTPPSTGEAAEKGLCTV
jgi:hypothetical protein